VESRIKIRAKIGRVCNAVASASPIATDPENIFWTQIRIRRFKTGLIRILRFTKFVSTFYKKQMLKSSVLNSKPKKSRVTVCYFYFPGIRIRIRLRIISPSEQAMSRRRVNFMIFFYFLQSFMSFLFLHFSLFLKKGNFLRAGNIIGACERVMTT
jgi:hypothetical protein